MEFNPRHLALLKRVANVVEARNVTTYQCVRKGATGDLHPVRVEIQEALPGVTPRYFIVASAGGRIEHDSGNDDLGLALSGIPWHMLEPQAELEGSDTERPPQRAKVKRSARKLTAKKPR